MLQNNLQHTKWVMWRSASPNRTFHKEEYYNKKPDAGIWYSTRVKLVEYVSHKGFWSHINIYLNTDVVSKKSSLAFSSFLWVLFNPSFYSIWSIGNTKLRRVQEFFTEGTLLFSISLSFMRALNTCVHFLLLLIICVLAMQLKRRSGGVSSGRRVRNWALWMKSICRSSSS